jgi:uncharacterized protein YbbC (DUF1343 family)
MSLTLRPRRSRTTRSAALLALASCIAAGCGGAADGSSSRRPPPLSQTAAGTTTSTAAASPVADAAVEVGLERLGSTEGRSLVGKRVGLIANAASVTASGRSAQQVLGEHGIRVVRLFAAEHGLSGARRAGERVGGNAASPTPVVSLYERGHMKPTRADLRGLDALVYDMQDAGVRFYTFVSTMIYAQQAAAAAGVLFVVLDRPNPLGGERVAGPVADLPESFVGVAPGPLVHGLTAGEMARYVQQHSRRRGRLLVVPMRGWRRSMTWADTGRRWRAPSPSLRSAEAALLYPGTALLEGTTATEGRGTAAPFRIVGAPWAGVDALLSAADVPGVSASARRFTPRPTPTVPAPKFSGQQCAGIALTLDDDGVDTFALGLRLLRALRADAHFAWLDGGDTIDTLLGTRRVRRALDRGASVEAILASQRAGVASWRQMRASALLYD